MKLNIPTLQQKMSRASISMTTGKDGQAAWTDYSTELNAIEGYAKNHVVFTCVHEISTSSGSVPFRLVKKSDGTEFETHPILDLLRRPNPYQAASSFWECVYAFYLLHGNSAIEAADMAGSDSPAVVEELYALPWRYMKVILGKKGVGGYTFTGTSGIKVEYPVNMINGQSFLMHWKTFNPESMWVGQAAISALGKSVDIHNSTNTWNKNLLDNGARPSGTFVYDDEEEGILTDEQYDRLKEQVDEEYAGAKNAGKAMLLEGGMKWQAMSLTPMDMDFISSKNISARDIAVSYGYPPVLLGLPEDNTYNNQQAARLALWTDTIMPLVTSMCDHLNRWLLPLFDESPDEIAIEPDFDQIGALQPIRDLQWKKAQESSDFLNRNERRKLIGYERMEGLDSILVPATLVPVAFASQMPTVAKTVAPKTTDDTKLIMMKASQVPMEMRSDPALDSREALTQDRLQMALSRSFEARLADIINEAVKDAQTVYLRKKSSERALDVLQIGLMKTRPLLSQLYDAAGEVAGARFFEGMKGTDEEVEVKTTNPETTFELEMLSWSRDHSLSQASLITQRSLDKAKKVFFEKAVSGDSIASTGRKLYEALGGEVSKTRAQTIAQTEIHQAYNVASNIAMEATGIDFDKRWISLSDADVRPDPKRANGQTVGKDERFSVGDSKLRFPGDPTGSAKETINCRCAVRYIPKV
jgi:HK97 family phage portal protein